MPSYLAPGVYIEEVSGGPRPIEAQGTRTAGFLGVAPKAGALVNEAKAVNSWTEFLNSYVGEKDPTTPLAQAVFGFFLNGGSRCYIVNVGKGKPITGGGRQRQGVDLLEAIDEVAIVAAPGFTDAMSYEALLSHCEKTKDRIAILDAPEKVDDISALTRVATADPKGSDSKQEKGLRARESPGGYGAYYFPWIKGADVLSGSTLVNIPPSGHVAGIYARTDALRGVHKAPANEPVRGALDVTYRVTHAEQEVLNPEGVNCIRLFSREGIVVYGSRTVAASSSEWKYVPVRRLVSMVEESIQRSMRWVVFEPNGLPLWSSIRRDVSAFLWLLWSQGALMGATPEEAFFVKCDAETNPPAVVDVGQVVTLIGIAPVKPAEFVIFRISQSVASEEITEQ